MLTNQSLVLKQISKHVKIIRFGVVFAKQDPWQKITGMFKFGKKVNIEQLLKQKGFELGK